MAIRKFIMSYFHAVFSSFRCILCNFLSTPADRQSMWLYRLLFVCEILILCICTVTVYSSEDKASGIKFCTVAHGRPGQGIFLLGELYSPRNPKLDN